MIRRRIPDILVSIIRKDKIGKIATLIFVIIFSAICSTEAQESKLIKGFLNPGNEARPRAYWNWLNGDVSHKGLTRDLEEAKAKGMGGLLMWDTEAMRNSDGFVPAGPAFMGPESVAAMHHTMEEAKRLDLELGLVGSSGWNSGGSWVTPEMASKNLFFASVVISGPDMVRQKLPFPEVPLNCPKGEDGLPLWYSDIAVLAWPDSEDKLIPGFSDIINLSDKFQDGELVWTPPGGKWQVVRFVCSINGQQLIAASPNSKGLFIDFLDPEATVFHFQYFINKLGLLKGENPDLPLKSIDDDSMELHPGIQWTNLFGEWFEKHNGYDPLPWLPVLLGWTIADNSINDRFIYDYNKTISDLLIFSHYKTGSDLLAEYGLNLVAEAGGPGPPFWESCPVDALKALGNVSIPKGEFWMGNPRNLFLIKEIASASHIYGKLYVDAESWTTWRRWKDSPFARKRLVDRAFCEGLNRVTYHGYSYSPENEGFPGRSYHAGVDMNPKVVWWSKAKPFMDYLARCSFMLQQGLYVADVAYYYGDQAPNFWPLYHDVPEKPAIEGLGSAYEYDVVNSDVILNRMSVKDGMIFLPDGMSYRVLVLPERKDMPLEILQKLEKLVSDGATVIGPEPSVIPGLGDFEKKTEALCDLAAKMWGDCNGNTVKVNEYGKGRVVFGYTPQQWLEKISTGPDFICLDPDLAGSFNFIHRRTEDSDIYFVSNKTMDDINTECLFRVEDRVPMLWDPENGTMKEQYVYNSVEGGIRLPVVLSPGASIFVVFNREASSAGFVSFAKDGSGNDECVPVEQLVEVNEKSTLFECWQNGTYLLKSRNGKIKQTEVKAIPAPKIIKGNWKLQFDPEWGAPAEIELPELISWTDHADDGVKYYSGKGVYNKIINVPGAWLGSGNGIYLDLGDVREVAEIYINGKSAGVLWKPPFRVDISSLLKPGDNDLKIEVMNLWINRLSGDMNLPDDKKFTRTNIRSDGGSWLENYEDWDVQPAGLLGPVRLLPYKHVKIKHGKSFIK